MLMQFRHIIMKSLLLFIIVITGFFQMKDKNCFIHNNLLNLNNLPKLWFMYNSAYTLLYNKTRYLVSPPDERHSLSSTFN